MPGAVDVRACLREAVVDCDPLGADVGNRRLGPHAHTAGLRGRRLHTLEVDAPAAELVLDGSRERCPLSEMSATSAYSATASLVLSCPSFSSISSGASRAAASADALLPMQRVEMPADPRAIGSNTTVRECVKPVDPAAGVLNRVFDRVALMCEPPVEFAF